MSKPGLPPMGPGSPLSGVVTHLVREAGSVHTLCGSPVTEATRRIVYEHAETATTRLCAMCVGRFHRIRSVDDRRRRLTGG
jgi:hypothetical protein